MDLKGIAAILGLAAAMVYGAESRYTPERQFMRHVAESRTGTILDLVERARESDGAFRESLCRALREEISALCVDTPSHPICEDRSMYLDQAGCF